MKSIVAITVNHELREIEVDHGMTLLELLRDVLKVKSVHRSCGEGECGACTVIIDGRAINSCLYPAPEVEGKKVITIEGLRTIDNKLSVIQEAFVEQGGIQCGFCTPGMIMSTKALLDANPDPTEEEIRAALVGNLCRCTGYVQIIDAVKSAVSKLKEKQ